MALRSGKKITFFSTKYFFGAESSCFFRHEILLLWSINLFLLIWNTFSCNINLFLSTPHYLSCNVKLFVLTQNCFSCNTKCLFWASFRMMYHGDIFLLLRSNKNVITCQKKKIIFVWHKKINYVFCASQIFCIQFLYCTLAACWSSS